MSTLASAASRSSEVSRHARLVLRSGPATTIFPPLIEYFPPVLLQAESWKLPSSNTSVAGRLPDPINFHFV